MDDAERAMKYLVDDVRAIVRAALRRAYADLMLAHDLMSGHECDFNEDHFDELGRIAATVRNMEP
jgi:hypothetical protein